MPADDGTPTPPPEAQLIRLAREALAISPETAVTRMAIKFSGTRWRQIENGYRPGTRAPVVGRAPAIAQMARAVGVTPDRLAATGRQDAADILREIERTTSADAYADLTDRHERAIWEMTGLSEQTRRDLIDALRASRERQRRAG